ncbi:hypothetical protein HDU98_002831 [Podochytrium sp. JEL0797]|nr:hypothetical protein HDU98_002831 [Podochytrium sp. JEL0797]
MAPPLALAFLEYALGLHTLTPYLYEGFTNASLLKSKIVTSQRTAILTHIKALFNAPLWFPATLVVLWLALVCASLFNAAMAKSGRSTHVLTFVVAAAAAVPVGMKAFGPLARINKTGKARVTSTEEIQALYDFGFVVIVDGFLFLFALLSNLTADDDEEEVVVKKSAKKSVKSSNKEEKLE